MENRYLIGNFCFSITCPDLLVIPENMMYFQVFEREPEYFYHIHIVERFPEIKGHVMLERPDLAVFSTPVGENRLIAYGDTGICYAYYEEMNDQKASIYLQENFADQCYLEPLFISLLALERHVLQKEGLVLHSAYMDHKGKAVLFSAPSGTGKSTQANLWKQYRGCETVNGDRCLLQKSDGVWMAKGWPICGSSEICNNKELEIEAIVLLSQAPENSIRRLSAMKAFQLLYSQITINSWSKEAADQAMALMENLIMELPVYQLACNISEDAVQCLEAELLLKEISYENE